MLYLKNLKLKYSNLIKRKIFVLLIFVTLSILPKSNSRKYYFDKWFQQYLNDKDIIVFIYIKDAHFYTIYFNVAEFRNNKRFNYFHIIDGIGDKEIAKLFNSFIKLGEGNNLITLCQELLKSLYLFYYNEESADAEKNADDCGYYSVEFIRYLTFNDYPTLDSSDQILYIDLMEALYCIFYKKEKNFKEEAKVFKFINDYSIIIQLNGIDYGFYVIE
ncbi:hypothetical protein ABK040_012200 [Willaertia magna]